MEEINELILKAIADLLVKKYKDNILFDLVSLSEQNNTDYHNLVVEIIEFNYEKLSKFQLTLEKLPYYLIKIFDLFLNEKYSGKLTLISFCLKELYNDKSFHFFYLKVSSNFIDNFSLWNELNEIGNKKVCNYILNDVKLKYFELLILYYNKELMEFTDEAIIKFIDDYLKISDSYLNKYEVEEKQMYLIITIFQFAEVILQIGPHSFLETFHKYLWTKIEIPNHLRSQVKIDIRKNKVSIEAKKIVNDQIHYFFNNLIKFKTNVISKKNVINLNKIVNQIQQILLIELSNHFIFEQQKQLYIIKEIENIFLLFNLENYLNTEKNPFKNIFEFYKIKINSETEIEEFIQKLEGYSRNFESLANESIDSFNAERIKELAKNLVNSIDEIFNEHLYLSNEIEEYKKIFKNLVFKKFYSKYKDKINHKCHLYLLFYVSELLGCSMFKLDIIEYIDYKYIEELVQFNLQSNYDDLLGIQKEKEKKLLEMYFKKSLINMDNDIDNFKIFLEEMEIIKNQNYNDIFEKTIEIIKDFNLDEETTNSFITVFIKKAHYKILHSFEYDFTEILSEYFKENNMTLSQELQDYIKDKMLKLKDMPQIQFDYLNQMEDLGITIEKVNAIETILNKSRHTIIDNFMKDYKFLNSELVKIRTPYLPFLIESLTNSEYILFTFLLEMSLQGILVNFSDLKKIEEITKIKERTLYSAYDNLVNKELIIIINDTFKVVIVNATKVNELAYEYYSKRISE